MTCNFQLSVMTVLFFSIIRIFDTERNTTGGKHFFETKNIYIYINADKYMITYTNELTNVSYLVNV